MPRGIQDAGVVLRKLLASLPPDFFFQSLGIVRRLAQDLSQHVDLLDEKSVVFSPEVSNRGPVEIGSGSDEDDGGGAGVEERQPRLERPRTG